MNIDFLHNQIVRDTITDKFIESFNENLMPYLISEYGSSLECVQFYEDHLADGLRIDGEFYYPLTLLVSGKPFIRAIKWQVSNYRNYDKFNPFTYKGKELLDFELLDIVPECVLRAVEGRDIYFDDSDAMPIFLTSSSPDKSVLVGKYSQTFIDLLAKNVTRLIEDEFSIESLSRSGVVLELRFEPTTFMEHIVENTTYRRLLIKARGCAERDLFIKWERLDGAGNYTISDNITEYDIIFSLADDVPSKIKEREYRYLTAESTSAYQTKMGRKNITEWREVMRRVIRRGEVTLVSTTDIPEAEDIIEEPIEDLISNVIEPVAEESSVDIPSEFDSFVALLDNDLEEEGEEEDDSFDDDLTALLQSAIGLSPIEETIPEEEVAEALDEEIEEPQPYEETIEEEVIEELPEETVEDIPELILSGEDEDTEEEALEPTPIIVEEISIPEISDEARIRMEIEARVRAEMEERFREKEREAEELRLRLEAQLRAEEREKERVAELARARLAENERLERERLERERLERERIELLERERQEREEAERLLREREEAERLRIEEEERLRLEASESEEEVVAEEEATPTTSVDEPIKYVAKTVKLFFKRPVKTDIANRIHEIILATIKYYHKENVYIKIKANFPDATTLNLDFVKIPENEIGLLVNIIKVLGRSDLGISKASLD